MRNGNRPEFSSITLTTMPKLAAAATSFELVVPRRATAVAYRIFTSGLLLPSRLCRCACRDRVMFALILPWRWMPDQQRRCAHHE